MPIYMKFFLLKKCTNIVKKSLAGTLPPEYYFYLSLEAIEFGMNQSRNGLKVHKCYCQEEGEVIECSSCKVKVHRECLPITPSSDWICDKCKYKSERPTFVRCFLCDHEIETSVSFRLYGDNWVHGECSVLFYSYVTTYRPEYDCTIKPEPREDSLTVDFMSFSSLFLNAAVDFSAIRGNRISALDLFLKQLLPSPTMHLHLTSNDYCFYCRVRGGFMVKCKLTSCRYLFHPRCCLNKLSDIPLNSIIARNLLFCSLHLDRKAIANMDAYAPSDQTHEASLMHQKPKLCVNTVKQKRQIPVASARFSPSKEKKTPPKATSTSDVQKATSSNVFSFGSSSIRDSKASVRDVNESDNQKKSAADAPSPIKPTVKTERPKEIQLVIPFRKSSTSSVSKPSNTGDSNVSNKVKDVQHDNSVTEEKPSLQEPVINSPPLNSTEMNDSVMQEADNQQASVTELSVASSTTEKPGDVMETEEEGEVCDICRYGYSEPDDQLVFCDKCNLAVHQSCYGISTLPDGDWMCSVCSHGKSPSDVRCYICLKSGGAMHRTQNNLYVHLICVFYTPELSLNFSGPEVMVEGITRISTERARLVCTICGLRGGGCIQCSSRSCSVAYHPYCAQQAGYLLTSDERRGQFLYLSYCDFHTRKKSGKKEDDEGKKDTSKKKRKGPGRRRREKHKEDDTSIPKMILNKLKPEKESVLSAEDFWSLMRYYYVVKPDLSHFESLFHFLFCFYPHLKPSELHSDWMPQEVVAYAHQFLTTPLTFSPELSVAALKTDSAFEIPSLGKQNRSQQVVLPQEQYARSGAAIHRATNSSLQRTQFQGFDINDFADLRDAYDCHVDYSFITWAQEHGICRDTSFRRAYRQDIPWLLQVNTINPTFSEEKDYSGTFYEKNEFVIIAERTNILGEKIPVGMVHYYLMWYYPCSGRDRDAVRAVYVCTLQKVDPSTHASFVNRYSVSAEPLTGSVLLSLAFLHGQWCQMTMGCCDSTDNSVSFYTSQYGMKALPKREGQHYTPMQINLTSFDARNVLLQHVDPLYKSTMLCTISQPSNSFASQLSHDSYLHLQVNTYGAVQKSEIVNRRPFAADSLIRANDPHWLQETSNLETTSLGRVCQPISDTVSCYLHNDTPHFVSRDSFDHLRNASPFSVNHAMYIKSDNGNTVISDGNEIERELEQCQDELFSAMRENEYILGKLTMSMLEKEKKGEESLHLVERCDKLHEELMKYTITKRPELAKVEVEDDTICDVCGDGDSDFGNVILYCDGCNVAVHQYCYDVMSLPKGDWFCNVCEDILVKQIGVTDVLHVTNKNLDENESLDDDASTYTVLDRLHDLRSKVHCCICGFSKGAMMPTLNEGEYAHVACGLWHPCCTVTNTHPLCSSPRSSDNGMEIEPSPIKEVNMSNQEGLLEQMDEPSNTVVPPNLSGKQLLSTTQNEDINKVDLKSEEVNSATEVEAAESSQSIVLIPTLVSPSPSFPDSPQNPSQNQSQSHSPDRSQPHITLAPAPTSTPTACPTSTPTPAPTSAPTPTQIPVPVSTPVPEPATLQTSNIPIQEPPQPTKAPYISPYARLRSDPEHRRYRIDTSLLGVQRKSLMCQLCRHRGGVIPCCCSGCTRGVHASCALEYELEMFWNNKIGRTSVSAEEVLVDKDFFLHCWQHSGGFQGRSVPKKQCEDWISPIGGDDIPRRKVNDDYLDEAQPVRKRGRPRRNPHSMEASQNQGLERMRKRREQRKQREKQKLSSMRSRPRTTDVLSFTRKPRSRSERTQQQILLWLKESHCSRLLMDNEENVLLKIQAKIDNKELPIYSNWKEYTQQNGTIQAFFRRCKKRAYYSPNDLLLEIREIYLTLLCYNYPRSDPSSQMIAKLVTQDALELTMLTNRLINMPRYQEIMENPDRTYCICMTLEWESDEFMVQCDGCEKWFHAECLGYAECKYLGYLSLYGGMYVDVTHDDALFYCPICYTGDNVGKMIILTEAEVIQRGAERNPAYVDPENQPVVEEDSQEAETAKNQESIVKEAVELPESEEKRPKLV